MTERLSHRPSLGARVGRCALWASLLAAGCVGAPPPSPTAPRVAATDAAALAAFPGLAARAEAFLPSDDSGLIGRNRTWGALYSPRFQLGAGGALRTALAAGRPAEAARAFRAVEVGTEAIEADGAVQSALPTGFGTPSATDAASAAAFFLGDACLGLGALDAAPRADAVAAEARRDAARRRLVRAVGWLSSQAELLWAADSLAPNRLLFDARAFQACGALSSDAARLGELERHTDAFARAALAHLQDDGHFAEGGGHDTSYQGVALVVGEDLLLAGYESAALADGLRRAADWLAGRVGPDGRIDSSGNARTCGGGETFGGEPKRVAVTEVFAGLAYAATRTGSRSQALAAQRVADWALANAGTEPCFAPRDGDAREGRGEAAGGAPR